MRGVPVTASPSGVKTRLVLSESAEDPGRAATWIGPLLALGTRVSRYSRNHGDRQLVVVLSVPKRDFAAALIGCGWVLASESPALNDPLETLRQLKAGQPIRAVNSGWVITGYFSSLDEAATPPRAQFAGSNWRVDGIRALTVLSDLDHPERELRPEPGSMEHMARLDAAWDARLALPAADLAIIGTIKWLAQDFLLGPRERQLAFEFSQDDPQTEGEACGNLVHHLVCLRTTSSPPATPGRFRWGDPRWQRGHQVHRRDRGSVRDLRARSLRS